MDSCVHVEALREVRMMMRDLCTSHARTAAQRSKEAEMVFRELADVILVALVMFAPAMATAMTVITVNRQVHTIALIRRECA